MSTLLLLELLLNRSQISFSQFIYPNPQLESKEVIPEDGQHESFLLVSKEISLGIKQMLKDWRSMLSKKKQQPQQSHQSVEPLISGALSLGLCRINKRKEEFSSSRISIISPATDHPFFLTTQYMNFMNCFFTAQKMDVAIDVATANREGDDSSNSILRTASDITGGTYLSIPNQKALLQYLVWVLLPDCQTRKSLVLPQKIPVGSRAACFCHRTLIDVGYVCSVCLSGEFFFTVF